MDVPNQALSKFYYYREWHSPLNRWLWILRIPDTYFTFPFVQFYKWEEGIKWMTELIDFREQDYPDQ